MIIQALVSLVVLVNMPTGARVVDNYDPECLGNFYRETEPQGMDQNARRICQLYENRLFYATLYSTFHRIPVYSAYKFDGICNGGNRRRCKWFIEPMVRCLS